MVHLPGAPPASGPGVKSYEMIHLLIVHLRQGFLLLASENICSTWCQRHVAAPAAILSLSSMVRGVTLVHRAFPGAQAQGRLLISAFGRKRSRQIPAWVPEDKAQGRPFPVLSLECGCGRGVAAGCISFLGPQMGHLNNRNVLSHSSRG